VAGCKKLAGAEATACAQCASPTDLKVLKYSYIGCADVMNWCAARRLQLNADKTEELLVDSINNLTKLASQDLTLTIGTETIKPTTGSGSVA